MAEKMTPIECRLTKELKPLRRLGWLNHYAAYLSHLVSILASFAASIIAASELGKCKIAIAILAAVPGTLLATQNVMRFEHKCKWYYKKAGMLQHELDAFRFENSKAEQASKNLKGIADEMDREWPGFGTLVVRQNEGTSSKQEKG